MHTHPGRRLGFHEIAELLTEARSRTLLLTAPLTEEEATLQHSPLMSPIIWDLGHIAHFEEVWLLENLETAGGDGEGLRGAYDPFRNPRSSRSELDLPSPTEARERMAAVRRAVLERLSTADLSGDGALLRDGFVFRMVLQHEYQHNETILQTLQLKKGRFYPAPRAFRIPDAPPDGGGEEMVRFPGGEVQIGTDDRSEAYDNERSLHGVALEPFWIDRTPVSSGAYREFVQDGGYGRRELWSEEGWAWVREEGARAPRYWTEEGGTWRERVMDRVRDVDPERPVCHVCYHEAEAYARWAEKRLPTEQEWEAAASWDPETGRKTRYPWGDEPPTPAHANLDHLTFDTAPLGAYPRNTSPVGCYGMIGDVWEWTSSDFRPYPGFEAFPYREYSEVFFGDDFKVLRGGSWATRPGAIRSTFRNWDYPIRRQIFSGFRCARDD